MKYPLTLLLLMPLFSCASTRHQTQESEVEFPYALLTEDFGLLTKEDLQINSRIAKPVPFSEASPSHAYPYWQCFEVKKSKMLCEGKAYDSDQLAHVSLLVLSCSRNHEIHEFIARRSMSIQSCHRFQKSWKELTKNEQYLCVSASDPSVEIKNNKKIWTWIFGRYKTRKGCDSYFQDECTLSKHP